MEKQKIQFQKLTPANDIDISVYEEAIDFVFENADITNVAISGSYSAGKSSVVQSYKRKHTDKKFIHISLAHFQDSQKVKEEEIKESVLEGKILNQLIHQIPSEQIPQTNFRIKRGNGKGEIGWITLLLCLLLGSSLYMFNSLSITSMVDSLPDGFIKARISFLTSEYAMLVAAIIFLICGIVCIYNVVKTQRNKNLFHRISIQGNEIEIFEKQEDSYFDKYLNEVLYLFEKADADVIVFEDMDRFNLNSIFERLREINHLTNNQRKRKCVCGEKYKPLRFLYLLRDDIFITKDRTKFFDFIIPVIPVLDGSNSYEQFVRYLKKANIFENFDESFIQRLSLYIDDMRILKNIYNEFNVYINRLNNTDLNWNKMLAIIVYKNLFPRDFSDLQLAKGYVHELFEHKEEISKEVMLRLENEKEELEEKIETIRKEVLISKNEIECVYDEIYRNLPRRYSGGLTIEAEREWGEHQVEKEKRIKGIEDKQYICELENQLTEIEKRIMIVNTQLLSELITRDNIDNVFMIKKINSIGIEEEYNEIKSNDYFELLKFLISNGYIDETYSDYMTYFYEESLTANDKTFLRRVTDKRGADYEYKLDNPLKVLSSPILREVDFAEEETLNFALLSELLDNQNVKKYQDCLQNCLEQLKRKKLFEFISRYYDYEDFRNSFIIRLNTNWPECFSYALVNKLMSESQIRRFSLDSLVLLKEQEIETVNSDGNLCNYISNQDDYLNIDSADAGNLISNFRKLGISFVKLDFNKSNKDIFKCVYEENMYELTFENIKLMLCTQYQNYKENDIVHKNYTLISKEPDSPLAMYIDFNLEIYMAEILSNCEGFIEDDEKDAINILNATSIKSVTKEKYIELLKTVLRDIQTVQTLELWQVLLGHNTVFPTIHNIVSYFNKYGLDDTLTTFIDVKGTNLDYSEVEKEFDENTASKLFDAIACYKDISNVMYKKILNEIGFVLEKVDDIDLPKEKMQILISEKTLQMNEENLVYLRENFPDMIMGFIYTNVDRYIEIQNSTLFNKEEIIKILDSSISDKKKIELLSYTNSSISVIDKNYSDELIKHILDNNLNENDIPTLLLNYSNFCEQIQKSIYQIALERVDEIIDENMVMDETLLSDIINKSNYSKETKIRLWAILLPTSNEELCKKHFDELGFSELKGIFTKRNYKTKTYKKDPDVAEIFKVLKKNTWIYSYYSPEDDDEHYVVIKNPPRSKTPDFLD